MRKKGLVLFIGLFLCLNTLFAQSQQLKLGLGNDIWTFGISQNNDDQLSFSSQFEYIDKNYELMLTADAITNRGWKLVWSSSDLYSGRYDVVNFDFKLNTLKLENEHFCFSLRPYLGFSFSGNLGFEKVQNFLHSNSSIPILDIPYEEDGTHFSPRLGGEINLGPVFPFDSEDSAFKLLLGATGINSFFFEAEFKAYGKVAVVSRGKSTLSLLLGYRYLHPQTDWMTHEIYSMFSNGWFMGFNFNLGLLSLSYQSNLENQIGYCTYSVDVLSLFRKSVFKEADLNYSIMFSYILGMAYHDAELSKEILDTNVSLGVYTRYFSAEPIPGELRKTVSSSSYYGTITYAFDYDYLSSWIVPYISLGIGLTEFSAITYFNTDESALKPFDKESDMSFSLDIAAGVTLFPPHLLDADNASYSLKIKAGVVYYQNTEAVRMYLPPAIDKSTALFPYFSVGCNIAIDI